MSEEQSSSLAETDDVSQKLDDAYHDIESARAHVDKAQKKKSVKFAKKAGGLYDTAQTTVASVQNVITAAQPLYESDAMKVVRDGIGTLMEGLPGVLKALDEVANIHPFIKVAVGAFRVVVELDMKRRENEKKVTILFVEMKDMMEVLIQLRAIKDEETPGPDGTTIKARMQELVQRAADDIKSCANACDAYAKKKLLVKVLKSSSWDDKFKGFLTLFDERRKAFAFALEMHVGKAVDDANRKLDAVGLKLDLVLTFFSSLVPADQQQLAEVVRNKGGPEAVMRDNSTLLSLAKYKTSSGTPVGKPADPHTEPGHSDSNVGDELTALREELFDSADAAMEKNLKTFERKFAMQQKKLLEEMQGLVRHESDRVIDSVLSGPHDRIRDRGIHELWKDMRWRGHVKARHFVLALRDFYLQSAEEGSYADDVSVPRVSEQDKWALEFIDVNYIAAIAEAFDEDASGFITIREVNRFTSSRPQSWSVVHWIAYWTKGWPMVCAYYVHKIHDIFAEMFGMLPHIRPENHAHAYRYLDAVWKDITTFTAPYSTMEEDDSDPLWARFQTYIEQEEKRLDDALKTLHYEIDAQDTITLIAGARPIERYLLPLIYLLLRRDLEVFRLAHRRVILSHGELKSSERSIRWVIYCAQYRGWVLQVIFSQRGLDPAEQFKTFARGFFYNHSEPGHLWSMKVLTQYGGDFLRTEYLEDKADSTVADPETILNCPTPVERLLDSHSESLTEADLQETGLVKVFLGRWNGFFGEAPEWPGYPMVTFFLHTAGQDSFQAKSRTTAGYVYTMSGTCKTAADGTIEVTSKWVFSNNVEPRYIKGTLSENGQSISGVWGNREDALVEEFYWSRVAPEILAVRPTPQEFRENRIRALWRYALDATRDQVQRRASWLSWQYIRGRNDMKRAYVDITQNDEGGLYSREDLHAMALLERALTYDEVCSCFVILELRNRVQAPSTYWCNSCGQNIDGARYTCIPCCMQDDNSVDICDKPECRDAPIKEDNYTHQPTHDMIKIRGYPFHYHDLPKLCRDGKELIAAMETALSTKLAPAGATARPGPSSNVAVTTEKTGEDGPQASTRAEGEAKEGEAVLSPVSDADDTVKAETGSARIRRRATLASSKVDTAPATCVSCKAQVTLPCFVCIDCTDFGDKIYICRDCDEQLGGVTAGRHLPSHTLARGLPADAKRADQKAAAVEDRLHALESQVASYADRFTAITERMAKMEELLEGVSLTLMKLLPA
ncbi:hypothetical protein BD413DRAFT_141310 [Trametes elegans]|nr:hypothetical protein BD413DRAFT_141310 [Trametes elegans]